MHPLEQALEHHWPVAEWRDRTVLVAVSGGPDSVALLRLLHARKTAGEGRLVAAHFNHRLRGAESEADERFVADLCRRLDIACEVGRAEAAPPNCGDGPEAAARKARYDFLRATAGRAGARFVVTAHTADDQAETILHRIVRGTGLRGLAGIRRARPLAPGVTLLRPLLALRRTELLAYLSDLGQPYRVDATNQDRRFTRNRLRHEVLPLLAEAVNPDAAGAIVRLGHLAAEAHEVLDRLAADLAERCVRELRPGLVQIDAAVLASQPRYLVREILMGVWRRQGWPLKAMGLSEWDALAALALDAAAARAAGRTIRDLPGGVRAEVASGRLELVGPSVVRVQ